MDIKQKEKSESGGAVVASHAGTRRALRRVARKKRDEEDGSDYEDTPPPPPRKKAKGTSRMSWNASFERLVAYKKEHGGSCRVPFEYKDDKPLAQWVITQRTRLKHGKICPEQKAKLDQLGFVWDASHLGWNHMFERLETYKSQQGDCMVPMVYDKDTALAHWVMAQRAQNKEKKLSPYRVQKLDAIGFVWAVYPRLRSQEEQWNSMFAKLKAHMEKHGDLPVPQNNPESKKVAQWVGTQRVAYRAGKMTVHRKAKLDKLGFVWDVSSRANSHSKKKNTMSSQDLCITTNSKKY